MEIFPYANIVVGILLFIVGVIFHWIGQLVSVINWEFARKIGIREKKTLPEFEVYERGMATAEAIIGWIYVVAAVGLFYNIPWSYTLAWFPGSILVYHSISYWFWIGNQNKSGNPTTSNKFRIVWFLLNLITGVLCILIAW
ncbi:MAG: hypothetical protein ACFFEO_15215 [Candidatus Thorarchaeota archaeon]